MIHWSPTFNQMGLYNDVILENANAISTYFFQLFFNNYLIIVLK